MPEANPGSSGIKPRSFLSLDFVGDRLAMRIADIYALNFNDETLLNHFAKFGFCLLIGVFVLGCASRNDRAEQLEKSSNKILVENVPFYPDDRYWCGPAALSALLNYHGSNVSIEDVADSIYSESAKGTVPFDMVWYAEEIGYDVTKKRGDPASINKWLRRDHPIIVFVDNGNLLYSAHHYMVVVGMSDHKVIVNSGQTRHKVVSRGDFRSSWAKENNWMMVIQ